MNVVAFKPASNEANGPLGPHLSAEHLRMLSEAIDFGVFRRGDDDLFLDFGDQHDVESESASSANDDHPRRNYLVTTPGTDTAARVTQLVNLGLMECAAGPLWRGQYVHTVTEAGRQLIEDFYRALFPAR